MQGSVKTHLQLIYNMAIQICGCFPPIYESGKYERTPKQKCNLKQLNTYTETVKAYETRALGIASLVFILKWNFIEKCGKSWFLNRRWKTRNKKWESKNGRKLSFSNGKTREVPKTAKANSSQGSRQSWKKYLWTLSFSCLDPLIAQSSGYSCCFILFVFFEIFVNHK